MLHVLRNIRVGDHVISAFSAVFLLALSGTHADAQTRPIVAAVAADTPSMDPIVESSPAAFHVRQNVYDQLTEISATGDLLPRLATAWEANADASVWTITIRRGVTFHDGKPLTVDDVIWTYETILANQASPLRTFLTKIKTLERVNDDTVRITLNASDAVFGRTLSILSILPKHAYEQMGQVQFGQAPIGSGPYRVARWIKDDRLELEAYEGYWRGAPKLKSVIIRPIPAEASRASALMTGEVDVVTALPAALVDRLQSAAGVNVETAPGSRVIFMGFNSTVAPLDSAAFRKAVDHAIDRKTIIDRLLRGMGEPAGQIVPPVHFGFDPSITPTAYDPDKARALIAESGYDGREIVFEYPTNNLPSSNEVAQAVAGYLQAVGIKVSMKGSDYNGFFPLWASRKLSGIYMFAYGSSIYDANNSLTALYEENSRIYTVNKEIDALAKQQRASGDQELRKKLISQIFQISKSEALYVHLYSEIQAYGLRDGVKWTARPDGILRFFEFEPPTK